MYEPDAITTFEIYKERKMMQKDICHNSICNKRLYCDYITKLYCPFRE